MTLGQRVYVKSGDTAIVGHLIREDINTITINTGTVNYQFRRDMIDTYIPATIPSNGK